MRNSKLTDILYVDTADQLTGSLIKLDLIDNTVPNPTVTVDPTKSGLLNLVNIKAVKFDKMYISSSTLTQVPAILTDSCSSIGITDSSLISLQVSASDLVVVRKPTEMNIYNVSIASILNS